MELLAPAGDANALQAALATGADAVYLGLDQWSARAFAGNFTGRELIAAVERAHLYGARAHLALNTLLKDDELGPALAALKGPYEAGLDAIIVADLGFAALVRESYPLLELHASTQLNTHSSAQLAALAQRGFARAILARELSLAEIERLDSHGLELEVFVHGALCYGYSGLCLFSSMIGGRSGNRGRCSQSCRMRYRLLAAEKGTALTRVLSTSDLAAIGALPQLLRAGVAAFKIEGRMKDAVYVAAATAVYREALDAAATDPDGYQVRPEWMRRLEQSFSRGFTVAHLEGRHAQVRGRGRGGHRGVVVGRVESVDEGQGQVVVRLAEPLHDDDVVSIYTPDGQTEPVRVGAARVDPDAGSPPDPPAVAGGSRHRPAPAGSETPRNPAPVAGAEDRITLRVRERVSMKDRVFRLSSAEIDGFAQAAVAGRLVLRPLPLEARLGGRVGERLRLTLTLEPTARPASAAASAAPRSSDVQAAAPKPLVVTAETAQPLREAETAPLTAAKARSALGALGGTPYTLGALDYQVEGQVFIAVGTLKALRRSLLGELDERRLAASRREAPSAPVSARAAARVSASRPQHAGRASSELPVVVRVRPGDEPSAVRATAWCLELAGDENPQSLTALVAQLHRHGGEVRCRPPEVLFDEDVAWWRDVAALPWDAMYARHLAHLASAAPAILEYPLQGLNAESARCLRPRAVVPSPEASLEEIALLAAELAGLDPPAAVEAVVFGRQQLLVSRDQLGVSEGLVPDPPPSEPRSLSLVDGKGFVFRAVVDRRGTRIGNARVTNVAPHLGELAGAGVGAVIVTLADMSPGERQAFAANGVAGLAGFATRDRSTTGRLFRGVA